MTKRRLNGIDSSPAVAYGPAPLFGCLDKNAVFVYFKLTWSCTLNIKLKEMMDQKQLKMKRGVYDVSNKYKAIWQHGL